MYSTTDKTVEQMFQAIETHGDAGKFGERVWRTIADRRTRAAAPDSTSAD